MTNKIIIAGGSGFLGNSLADFFKGKVGEIVILSRQVASSNGNVRTVVWDAGSYGEWAAEFENTDVVINLTGKSVDCRYTEKNKELILSSRINSTAIIGKAIQQCKTPPRIWINSSSATIYKSSFDKYMTEAKGDIGDDFSMNVCKKWEEAFNQFELPQTRKIALRTSIVFGKNGGALKPLSNLVRAGLGGSQGKGNQFVSWLHVEDFCRIVEWVIHNQTISGVYNVAAPNPITNAEFMKTLRQVMNVSFGMPLPLSLLKFGAALIGTETELVLKSRKVIPERLLLSQFQFKYSTIDVALKDLLAH